MRHLWHLAYWPALLVCIVCLIANFFLTLLHCLAQEIAEHAQKKLRARRPA